MDNEIKKDRAARGRRLRELRHQVAELADRRLSLTDFLVAVAKLDDALREAVDGIWCGREGRETCDVDISGPRMLVVGWHEKRVEYAYLS